MLLSKNKKIACVIVVIISCCLWFGIVSVNTKNNRFELDSSTNYSDLNIFDDGGHSDNLEVTEAYIDGVMLSYKNKIISLSSSGRFIDRANLSNKNSSSEYSELLVISNDIIL